MLSNSRRMKPTCNALLYVHSYQNCCASFNVHMPKRTYVHICGTVDDILASNNSFVSRPTHIVPSQEKYNV